MCLVCAICVAAAGHGDILAVGITMSCFTCNPAAPFHEFVVECAVYSTCN
jgi:hypothetical protein